MSMAVAKKKSGRADKTDQINVRVSAGIKARVENAADGLGLKPSDLVRMMLVEYLHVYEDRARKVRELDKTAE